MALPPVARRAPAREADPRLEQPHRVRVLEGFHVQPAVRRLADMPILGGLEDGGREGYRRLPGPETAVWGS